MLDFKMYKRCSDWRKFLIEWRGRVPARVVFRKAVYEIEQSVYEILRIIINCLLLYNFPRKSLPSPSGGTHCSLKATGVIRAWMQQCYALENSRERQLKSARGWRIFHFAHFHFSMLLLIYDSGNLFLKSCVSCILRSWGSWVSIGTSLREGRPTFDSRVHFATASIPALGPAHPDSY